MFFKTSDFSPDTLSVFKFGWSEKVQDSDVRPYHALSFRLKGKAKFTHEKETVVVKTGDIVFVPAFYPYTLDCGEEKVIVVHFTTSGDMPDHIRKYSPDSSLYYEKLFLRLFRAYTKKETGFEHECRSLFHKIIAGIERERETEKIKSANSGILSSIETIHEHFTDPQLTVAHLAKNCHISETYFRKLFQQYCGISPLQYINELRLKYAMELLRSRYYTVSEVAEKCGFANPYYFSLFIKKHTGKPPSDFIKEAIGHGSVSEEDKYV